MSDIESLMPGLFCFSENVNRVNYGANRANYGGIVQIMVIVLTMGRFRANYG